DILQIDRNIKENQKLPALNAVGGYQLSGLGDSAGKAIDSLESGNYHGWNAGLNFLYPLQNRQARARYEQAVQSVAQQQVHLRDLEELIRLEVRTAVRALETNRRLISAFDANVKAEEAKLDSQIKRYDVGFATIFEVLNFQEDLATAQVSYLQSIINFSKSLIELQRVKASFLTDYRVEYLDNTVQQRAAQP
ncbi:TolC family protein, partial [bacterium]|nr:TolC family protein [bacterium]